MKSKSTMLASVNVLSSIFDKINYNKKTVFALIDLKKAFDFINHELLLIKLKHFSIRGLLLFWLSIVIYLTDLSLLRLMVVFLNINLFLRE